MPVLPTASHIMPYLALTAHPAIGAVLLDPRPAWVWNHEGNRIIWSNAAGLAFFQETDMQSLLDRTFGDVHPARRHLARLALNSRPNAPLLDRLRFFLGVNAVTTTCLCKRLEVEGESMVLVLSTDANLDKFSEEQSATRLVEALSPKDSVLSAIMDGDSRVLAASSGFESLVEFSEDIDALLLGADEPNGLAIDILKEDEPQRIGGVARIGTAQDVRYLLLVAHQDDPSALAADFSALEDGDGSGSFVSDEVMAREADIFDMSSDEIHQTLDGKTDRPNMLDHMETASFVQDGNVDLETPSEADYADLTNETSKGSNIVTLPFAAKAQAQKASSAAPISPSTEELSDTDQAQLLSDEPLVIQKKTDAPVDQASGVNTDTIVEADKLQPADTDGPVDLFRFNKDGGPYHFVWESDEIGRFSFISKDLADAVGPDHAAIVGQNWSDLTERLSMDQDGQIAAAFAARDTWTGLSVDWPVQDHDLTVPVELTGLPVFGRFHGFQGFRGFGICRTHLAAPITTEQNQPPLCDGGTEESVSDESKVSSSAAVATTDIQDNPLLSDDLLAAADLAVKTAGAVVSGHDPDELDIKDASGQLESTDLADTDGATDKVAKAMHDLMDQDIVEDLASQSSSQQSSDDDMAAQNAIEGGALSAPSVLSLADVETAGTETNGENSADSEEASSLSESDEDSLPKDEEDLSHLSRSEQDAFEKIAVALGEEEESPALTSETPDSAPSDEIPNETALVAAATAATALGVNLALPEGEEKDDSDQSSLALDADADADADADEIIADLKPLKKKKDKKKKKKKEAALAQDNESTDENGQSDITTDPDNGPDEIIAVESDPLVLTEPSDEDLSDSEIDSDNKASKAEKKRKKAEKKRQKKEEKLKAKKLKKARKRKKARKEAHRALLQQQEQEQVRLDDLEKAELSEEIVAEENATAQNDEPSNLKDTDHEDGDKSGSLTLADMSGLGLAGATALLSDDGSEDEVNAGDGVMAIDASATDGSDEIEDATSLQHSTNELNAEPEIPVSDISDQETIAPISEEEGEPIDLDANILEADEQNTQSVEGIPDGQSAEVPEVEIELEALSDIDASEEEIALPTAQALEAEAPETNTSEAVQEHNISDEEGETGTDASDANTDDALKSAASIAFRDILAMDPAFRHLHDDKSAETDDKDEAHKQALRRRNQSGPRFEALLGGLDADETVPSEPTTQADENQASIDEDVEQVSETTLSDVSNIVTLSNDELPASHDLSEDDSNLVDLFSDNDERPASDSHDVINLATHTASLAGDMVTQDPNDAGETVIDPKDMITVPEPVSLVSDQAYGTDLLPILDKIPSALIISANQAVQYANSKALDLLGFEDLAQFEQAGGMEALFGGRPGDWLTKTEGLSTLRKQDGSPLSAEAKVSSIQWQGEAAAMLSFEEARAEMPGIGLSEEDQKIAELEAILDTATDGVVVLDDRACVLRMNHSAEALFEVDRHEMAGESFLDLLAEESHKDAIDYLDGLMANGVASVLNDGREVIGRVSSGGLIPLFMTMGRVAIPGTNRFCAVVRDIAQWKRAEEDLLAEKRRAEKANNQKSDFLAKISHEIRTPLNAIIGFSEVMIDERFGAIGNDRYKDYLKDIHTSGSHIMSLINDLLDLSKVEAGKMDLSFQATELNALVQESVGLMQPQANREQIIIRTSLASELPDIVGDARSLRQIILNLLSNGVKYTQAGGQVIISTSYEENGEVILRIRDTGIGMSEDDVKTALEPFRQVSSTSSKGGQGTGLGLPLTKALVEANRAQFSLVSAKDHGTLVEITFPNARVLAS